MGTLGGAAADRDSGGRLRAVGGASSLVGAETGAETGAAGGLERRETGLGGAEDGGELGVVSGGWDAGGRGRVLWGPGTTGATGHWLAPSPSNPGSRETAPPRPPVAMEGARPAGSGSSRAVASGLGAAGIDPGEGGTSLSAGLAMTSVTAVSSEVRFANCSRRRLAAPSASLTPSGGGLGAVCGAVSSAVPFVRELPCSSGADGRGGGASSRVAAAGCGGASAALGAPAIGPSVRRGGGRLPSGGRVSDVEADDRGALVVDGGAEAGPSRRGGGRVSTEGGPWLALPPAGSGPPVVL